MWWFAHIVSPSAGRTLERGVDRRLVQMDFSTAFDRVSYWCLPYNLRSICIGAQFLSMVTDFLSDRRQLMRLDDKVSVSVDVVSRISQGSILRPFLFVLTLPSFSTLLGTILWATRMKIGYCCPSTTEIFLWCWILQAYLYYACPVKGIWEDRG